MYYQKDYILRMIEMLGKLFEELMNKMERSDALDEIDQIAHKACGLPVSVLLCIHSSDLMDMLSDLQRYFAAELLIMELSIQQRALFEDELFPRKLQILELLSTIEEADYILSACDRAWRIVQACEENLPAEILTATSALFERGGQYAHAEDMLYAALEQSKQIKPLIRSFYQRVSLLDDKALSAGGLPRDEVEEGMQALTKE